MASSAPEHIVGAVTFTAALDWREAGAAGLLHDYAAQFRAGDAATLLIHGGSAAEVVPVAAELADGSPDMVLVEHVEATELEPRIDAVLSAGPATVPWRTCRGWTRRACGRSSTCAWRGRGGPTASPATCAARRRSPRRGAGRATRPPARGAGRPPASAASPT